jgi:hypothetical protein
VSVLSAAVLSNIVSATGSCQWALALSSTAIGMTAVRVHTSSDSVFVAGTFSGLLYLGPISYVGGLRSNAFVTRVTPAGAVMWTSVLSSNGTISVARASVDRDGNMVLAGTFTGALFVGNTYYGTADTPTSTFVAKTTPTGAIAWVTVSVAQDAGAYATAVWTDTASNGFVLSGAVTSGRVRLGGCVLGGAGAPSSVYAALIDPVTGACSWAQSGTVTAQSTLLFPQQRHTTAQDHDGTHWLIATVRGAPLNFGSMSAAPECGAAPASSCWGLVVARISPTGAVLSVQTVASSPSFFGYVPGLRYDSAGTMYLAGSFQNSMTLLGGTLVSGSAATVSAFLLRLSTGQTGLSLAQYQIATGVTPLASSSVAYVAIDGNDNAVVVGTYIGQVDLAPGLRVGGAAGQYGGWAMTLAANGAATCSAVFYGPSNTSRPYVSGAVDVGSGQVFVGGTFVGQLSFPSAACSIFAPQMSGFLVPYSSGDCARAYLSLCICFVFVCADESVAPTNTLAIALGVAVPLGVLAIVAMIVGLVRCCGARKSGEQPSGYLLSSTI